MNPEYVSVALSIGLVYLTSSLAWKWALASLRSRCIVGATLALATLIIVTVQNWLVQQMDFLKSTTYGLIVAIIHIVAFIVFIRTKRRSDLRGKNID